VRKLRGVDMFTVRVRSAGMPAGIIPGVPVLAAGGNRVVVVVSAGAELRVTLEPRELALLEPNLRLLDASGRPMLLGAGPTLVSMLPFATDGTLVLRGLTAGDVTPELVTVVQGPMRLPQRLAVLPRTTLRDGAAHELVASAPAHAPGQLRGRVLADPGAFTLGTPIAIVSVEQAPLMPLPARMHGPVPTGSDGAFEIALPPGRYRVRTWWSTTDRPRLESVEDVEVSAGATVEQTFVLR
jgi:hypothetical protein